MKEFLNVALPKGRLGERVYACLLYTSRCV